MTKPEDSRRPPESESELLDELVEQALLDLMSPHSLPAGKQRLLQSVTAVPLRYAPFFGRLGALWDLSEDRVETALAESARVSWHLVWPGIRFLTLTGGPALEDGRARLLRFDPGVRFPTHRHTGDEEVMVLEGSYTDSNGLLVKPGEVQRMAAGSEHALQVSADSACVAAIVQRGLSFTAPLVSRVKRFIKL
ncbi:MAG: cupin domain-containing protein [Myxococcota bacterium]